MTSLPFLGILLLTTGVSTLSVYSVKRQLAPQLLDIPNDRSSHTQPTPRGGGLGFILSFALFSGFLSFTPIIPNALAPLQTWVVLLPLAVIGFLDDRGSISAKIRYLVQLLCAGLALYCFGAFPQPWLTHWGAIGSGIALLLTLIGFTALINFTNFMDGLDGLVGGVSVVQFAFLALYLQQPVWWLLVAALLGFLIWNWSPAKIFMGDVGSTALGGALAIALLNASSPSQAWSALAITLPLTADAIYTLIRRLIRRENIFAAHRFHLYQRLQQHGWSHGTRRPHLYQLDRVHCDRTIPRFPNRSLAEPIHDIGMYSPGRGIFKKNLRIQRFPITPVNLSPSD
uniref:MraY family glycosyltransferase n=1 Tax=Petrachloros mirabilis TaxID=2918835 RepID=UPI001EE8D081|nr:glycosyltransferase family 4 protein [Petrachloros mirabilis]